MGVLETFPYSNSSKVNNKKKKEKSAAIPEEEKKPAALSCHWGDMIEGIEAEAKN